MLRANDGSRTGGEMLVDQLVAHGVEHVFCVPGESYLAALDAFHDRADHAHRLPPGGRRRDDGGGGRQGSPAGPASASSPAAPAPPTPRPASTSPGRTRRR